MFDVKFLLEGLKAANWNFKWEGSFLVVCSFSTKSKFMMIVNINKQDQKTFRSDIFAFAISLL